LTTPRLRCDWYYSWNGCRVCSNKGGPSYVTRSPNIAGTIIPETAPGFLS
jgi:hypothetical protein